MAINIDTLDATAADSFAPDLGAPSSAGSIDELNTGIPNVEDLPGSEHGSDGFFDEDDVYGRPQQESDESLDGEATDEESDSTEQEANDSSLPKMTIDIEGKQVEFALDPEDETLRRTLRRGVKFDKLKEKFNIQKSEVAEYAKVAEDAKEAQEVFSAVQEHIADGNVDYAVRAFLGERYSEYMESQIEFAMRYADADPRERELMDKEREATGLSQKERQKDRELRKLKEQLELKEMDTQTEKYNSIAQSAYRKAEISADEVNNESKRYALNKRLWKNSWSTIEELQDGGRTITPKLMQKVFSHESKLLKSLLGKSSGNPKVKEKKQEMAKQTAAAVATQNYPSNKERNTNKHAGKSFRQLLDLLK